MAINAPIIRTQDLVTSYTLPHVSEFVVTDRYIRAHIETANGTNQIQTINTNLKRSFRLKWAKLSAANLVTLRAAFALMRDGAVIFQDLDGNSWTVIHDPGQKDVDYEAFSVMQGTPTLYYRGEWKLIQI